LEINFGRSILLKKKLNFKDIFKIFGFLKF
jgi:hypothetical protein